MMLNEDKMGINGGTVDEGAVTSASGGSGYVAGASIRSGLASMLPGQPQAKYLAVESDDQNGNSGRFSRQNARQDSVASFDIELLSDFEGASQMEKRDVTEGKGKGLSEDDRWMRNIWSLPNLAVVMSYFCVGFAMRFLTTPMSYYMVQMGAEPAQQNVVLTLAQLPWSFKLVFGFISDNFPIGGMRRKPYFIIGWAVYVAVNLMIATSQEPSVQLLAGGRFVSTVGFMISDVTTDAILVERSKHEPRERRGSMQAIGYSTRFVGSVLGSVLGMILYNKEKWGWGLSIQGCFLLNGVFPFFVIGPWVWQLRETQVVHEVGVVVTDRLVAQSLEVFGALEQKAVYGPMAVVFIYNLLQVPNAAWTSFLVKGLSFEPVKIGILGVIASIMAAVGLIVYKTWFFHTSWRKIYIWATMIVTFFSLFQLLLIFRVNVMFGIPDLAFAVGDDSIQDLVLSIQFLPVVQMYISMCPDGAEGTTYAILTTMSNVAGNAAYSLATLFTKIWDVSNEALLAGDFTGIWKLTLLTSLIQPVGLLLIRGLPANQAEQRLLQNSGIRDPRCGMVLLGVLFLSLAITIGNSIAELSG